MTNPIRYTIDNALIQEIEIADVHLSRVLKQAKDANLPPGFFNNLNSLLERVFFLGANADGDPHCPFIEKIRPKKQ